MDNARSLTMQKLQVFCNYVHFLSAALTGPIFHSRSSVQHGIASKIFFASSAAFHDTVIEA